MKIRFQSFRLRIRPFLRCLQWLLTVGGGGSGSSSVAEESRDVTQLGRNREAERCRLSAVQCILSKERTQRTRDQGMEGRGQELRRIDSQVMEELGQVGKGAYVRAYPNFPLLIIQDAEHYIPGFRHVVHMKHASHTATIRRAHSSGHLATATYSPSGPLLPISQIWSSSTSHSPRLTWTGPFLN